MQAELAKHGLGVAVPLGFPTAMRCAMREADAKRLGIARLSDLQRALRRLRWAVA